MNTASARSDRLRLRSLYTALWVHAAGRRGQLLAAYMLLIGAELLRLLSPWLTGRAINHIQQGGTAGMAAAGQEMLWVLACVCAGWCLHGPGRILERNVGLYARDNFCRDLLERLLHAPLAWHQQEPGLQRAQRVLQASQGLHSFSEAQYIYVQNTVMVIGPLLALWTLSPWVGLAAMLGFGLLGTGSVCLDRLLVRLNDDLNECKRRHEAQWGELLTGISTVLALRGWQTSRRWVSRQLQALAVPLRRMVVVNEVKWAAVEVGATVLWAALVALYVVAGPRDVHGAVALGSVYMVYEYARRAETVLSQIASDFSQMAGQLADHAAGSPILEAPSVGALPALHPTPWTVLTMQAVTLTPARFARPGESLGASRIALQRGRRYALVGPSGSGKTTLLRLLAGLEPARDGHILLDDQAVDAARLRCEATLLPQDALLFEGPLQDNLLLSDEAQSQDIPRALAVACADDFVTRDTDLQTVSVSEGGSNWSGGQRQRLALARGLLAAETGAMMLLDEPTAALDAITQGRVLSNLWAASRHLCVVVTLHRLELLSQVDEVIVMKEGLVVDQGPVEAVRQRCVLFQSMLGPVAAFPQGTPGGPDVDG